ncbi:MAG: potassium uptake protein, TrkH family [Oscillospiraceae bacterium]|nr:potassium uptake protein, TrkH family [Oscillospiraceae bacterium]
MRGKTGKKLLPTQIIAISFALVILAGAVLLCLPIASRNGQSLGFRTSLFTATSATCVTGLILGDTWTLFSGFGQAVIITLIEIGGLGFMSVASLVIFMLRRKIGLRQRLVIAQALSVEEIADVVRIQKWVLWGSLIVQTTGALVLFFRFLPEYGWARGAKWGVFHAISAFCNAGFDIVGDVSGGVGMMYFADDPVVLITLMTLIVVGGLGFFVWQEIAVRRSFRKFGIYTRLVLLTSGVLILAGALLFGILEWNNPQTLGAMPVWQKILNAFFQSVTTRTAGFASLDQAALTEGSKAVSVLWMLIGGASGSTAGGVKMVTFLVLILFVISRARGKSNVTVFHRTIPQAKVLDAAALISLVLGLAFLGAIFITATSPVGFTDALYETASALATVGLTAGVTPLLSVPAQIMIMIFMYFGRVGILTISLGFMMGDQAEERFRYAYTNVLIG